MKHINTDEIYRKLSPEEIPWNVEEPPDVLVELIESQKILPCKALDLGCGTGNYAIYLAENGFDVVGVDISPTAINIAKENAKKKGVTCGFMVADILGELKEITDKFDFAYDWGILHHFFPEQRGKYVGNVYRILNPGAYYMSVCFSEQDLSFKGEGKYRKTPLGTVLYFSSEDELRDLFFPYFEIEKLETIRITSRFKSHLAIYALMRKPA